MVILQNLAINNKILKTLNLKIGGVPGVHLWKKSEKATITQVGARQTIFDLIFDVCRDCARMASLPHGAFAACKLREKYHDRDMIVARMVTNSNKADSKEQNSNKKLTEYSPVKYNDKLMNSIWGLYNRYSPHNIKGNEYESADNGVLMQQQIAVASYAIAKTTAMAFNSGMEWNVLNK